MGQVESVVERDGKVSQETRYFITSAPRERADAGALLKWTRGHWSIEIPRSQTTREADNLCVAGRTGYHRRGGPAPRFGLVA